MEIFWHGNSSVTINSKNAKIGFNPRITELYDLQVYTHSKKDLKLNEGQFAVDSPGEYEVKGVMVYSVLNPEDTKRSAYQMIVDDISCFYTDRLDFVPSEDQLDDMGTIDVAFVALPINKDEEKQMQNLIEKIEPRIIIPIAKDDDTSVDVCVDLSRLLGLKCDEAVKSYKIKSRAQLPEDQQLYVALEKSK